VALRLQVRMLVRPLLVPQLQVRMLVRHLLVLCRPVGQPPSG